MSGKDGQILIVDDEYYLGQMLAQALQLENIKAIAVTEIDHALKWLNEKKIDLIISDIYLPGKNGLDLFNHVKNKKIEIPFIFMTGNPDLEMAVNFLTQGGYDYIVKPFMIQDFIKKVKSVLATHEVKKKEKKLVKDLRLLLAERLSELRIYQDTFESTNDGLVITDTEGNMVKINHGFEKITGMDSTALINNSLEILRNRLLPELNFKDICDKLKSESTWQGELQGKKDHNSKLLVNISFSPIRNEDSQIFAYAGLFKDVSEQQKVKQALIDSLQNMNLAQEAIIFGMARLAEFRDQNTGYHLERICNYCKVLTEELIKKNIYSDIIDSNFAQMLYRTAPLHDIGKVGIPDYILLKQDKLTEPEFEIMKSHTIIGYNTLNSILKQYGEMDFLKMGIEITLSHHERWDGKGYPKGLKGNKIPLSAQIIAVVDVYDALSTQRSYKEAHSHHKTLDIMRSERGKHFSARIFDVFFSIADKFDKIRQSYSEKGGVEDDFEININLKEILYQ